jgi:hypothetical protein
VILDKNPYVDKHALQHIRQSLTADMAKAVGCAVVGVRLDCTYSVLCGISQYNIDRLQRVQNLLARIVTATVRHHLTVTVWNFKPTTLATSQVSDSI